MYLSFLVWFGYDLLRVKDICSEFICGHVLKKEKQATLSPPTLPPLPTPTDVEFHKSFSRCKLMQANPHKINQFIKPNKD